MSWMTDILQGIPVNAVLKERLALAEQKFKDLEAGNKSLQDQVVAIKTENSALKEQLAQIALKESDKPELMYGCYYFGGDNTKLYCVACYETKCKRYPVAKVHGLGHKCTVCGSFVHR
jgi:hypothetical protein